MTHPENRPGAASAGVPLRGPRALWSWASHKLSKQNQGWLVLGLCLVAFAFRVPGLSYQSLWRDEVDALRFASRDLTGLLQTFLTPGENGPLYYLLLNPWLGHAGRSEFALRFFSALFGVLAVALVYRVARRLFGPTSPASLAAALLAATSPYLVWYGQEGKMYALVVVLILLSMDQFLAAMEGGGTWHWVAYVAVTTTAYYVHLMAVLVVPVQIVIFGLYGREARKARLRPWLASVAVLTVPYLPLLAWQLPALLRPGESGYRFVPLPNMVASLWTSYSFGVVEPFSIWSGALFIALPALALLAGRERQTRPAAVLVLLSWLALPVLILYLITLVRPMYTARYLIFVVPAYLLLVSSGLVAVFRRSMLAGGLLLAGLLVVQGQALHMQGTRMIKTDFRSATRYVVERSDPSDSILFQIPYGRYSFEYYVRRGGRGPETPLPATALQAGGASHTVSALSHRAFLPLLVDAGGAPQRMIDGLYTNWGMSPAEVDSQMAELVGGSQTVWFIETEPALWDERGLVKGWLDRNARQTEAVEFARVWVYRYDLPQPQ